MTYSQRIAQVVAYAINPLVLPPILLAIVVHLAGGSWRQTSTVAGVTLVMFCLIPLAAMYAMIRGQPGHTIELRDKSKRTLPYLVTAACGWIAIVLLQWIDAPVRLYLQSIVFCIALNSVFLMAINFFWKISLHCATLAGTVAILAFTIARGPIPGGLNSGGPLTGVGVGVEGLVSPSLWLAIVLAAGLAMCGLLMWARVHGRAHSVAEVLGGTLFGLVVPIAELLILDRAGLFR